MDILCGEITDYASEDFKKIDYLNLDGGFNQHKINILIKEYNYQKWKLLKLKRNKNIPIVMELLNYGNFDKFREKRIKFIEYSDDKYSYCGNSDSTNYWDSDKSYTYFTDISDSDSYDSSLFDSDDSDDSIESGGSYIVFSDSYICIDKRKIKKVRFNDNLEYFYF